MPDHLLPDSYSWAARMSLTVIFTAIALVMWSPGNAADDSASQDIRITLQSDGQHCAVRKVIIPCTDLASHLRDTLKLPASTMVRLRAGRSANYEAVRKVLTIIEKSGYNYPASQPRR